MEPSDRESADVVRSRLARGEHDRQAFRAALLRVAPTDRDAWLDLVLGLPELPEDGLDLPRGCVPYIPCAVDVLVRLVDTAHVSSDDVFVDVGSGLGRAAVLVHLLTGAAALGIEVQAELVRAAREVTARLALPHVAYVEGDAAGAATALANGSVFFLYCPFSGERLVTLLAHLEEIVRTRTIRVACLDLPLPPCPWLALESPPGEDLAVYRSTLDHWAVRPTRACGPPHA